MPSDLSPVLALLARVERNAYFQTAELRTALAVMPQGLPAHLRAELVSADRDAFASLLHVRQVRELFAAHSEPAPRLVLGTQDAAPHGAPTPVKPFDPGCNACGQGPTLPGGEYCSRCTCSRGDCRQPATGATNGGYGDFCTRHADELSATAHGSPSGTPCRYAGCPENAEAGTACAGHAQAEAAEVTRG